MLNECVECGKFHTPSVAPLELLSGVSDAMKELLGNKTLHNIHTLYLLSRSFVSDLSLHFFSFVPSKVL